MLQVLFPAIFVHFVRFYVISRVAFNKYFSRATNVMA